MSNHVLREIKSENEIAEWGQIQKNKKLNPKTYGFSCFSKPRN
jgi:hypothetical protein